MKRKEELSRGLDPELEALWREGLDESQYRKVMEKLALEAKPEVPRALRTDLLEIPSSSSRRLAAAYKFPFLIPPIPALAATAVILLVVSASLMIEHKGNQQIAVKADHFLQGIIDYDTPGDIFDTDVKLLERL